MRRIVAFGAVLVLFALSIGAAAGTFAVVRGTGHRIQLLGSGDAVSVLVTSDQSRLLIATGNDRTAFGNAVDRVATGSGFGPNVLIIAGDGRNLNVSTTALDQFDPEQIYALHPLNASDLGDTRLTRLDPLPSNPVRITLAERVTVTIESIAISTNEETYAWRTTISLNSSRVAIVSDGKDVPLFDWSLPFSAIIVAGDAGELPIELLDTQAIIAAASSLNPNAFETEGWAEQAVSTVHLAPIRPGDVATLTFDGEGLTVTSDGHITEIQPATIPT